MDRRRIGGPPRRKRAPEMDFDAVLYGIHAVDEALAAGEPLVEVHLADDRKRDPLVRRILERAKAANVAVRFQTREWFARLPYKAHQGAVAIAPPFEYASLHDVIAGHRSRRLLVVVLDHVTDPHNLGAIIRTAECAGADAVVIPDRRAAGVNATVRKTAAGATEHLPIVRVGNIAEAIRQLKKAGAWVAGADADDVALELTAADLSSDLVLVIGAEGEGLGQLVRRECDFLVKIPLLGKVASLNASVAAAILLYEAVRQGPTSQKAP
ncbi:MAG TPA: 23S rRNA (guanosine(2251)-2'-O)-methyltransferase RlmB [Candidatus Baltobacteraceae bacterium]